MVTIFKSPLEGTPRNIKSQLRPISGTGNKHIEVVRTRDDERNLETCQDLDDMSKSKSFDLSSINCFYFAMPFF